MQTTTITLQRNKITGLAYQGRNQTELLSAKTSNNFASDEWLTFLQAKNLNLKIVKGSKGQHIFLGYGSFTDSKEDKDGNKKITSVSRPLGWACVFNLDQTESLESAAR